MAELTEREKKIVFIKFIMHGPQFQQVPVNLREVILKTVMGFNKLEYKKDEMLDLGNAILAEQDQILKSGIGILNKYKNVLQGDTIKF